MAFVQSIDIETGDITPVKDLVNKWHEEQAGVAPGYQATRILAEEGRSNRYVIEVDFSSKADAEVNNARPETEAWAKKLAGVVQGEPTFRNFDLVCTTS